MSNLRILVGDDHEIVRCGLSNIIQRHPGWEVCGEAVDGAQAVELAKALNPDVILLDISMPRLSGLEAAREILQSNPRARILFLTFLIPTRRPKKPCVLAGRATCSRRMRLVIW